MLLMVYLTNILLLHCNLLVIGGHDKGRTAGKSVINVGKGLGKGDQSPDIENRVAEMGF